MSIQPPNPTLIIGLGGTGQWVATHVAYELKGLYGVENIEALSPRVQILAIDTDFRQEAEIGGGQVDELGGVSVGQIRLPRTMVLPLGANVHGYVRDIQGGKRREIGAWFDAKWFLDQPTHDVLLDLTKGAGRFRPLGRIAVPFNLTEGGGILRAKLSEAIQAIELQEGESLVVCITGSLCGGTGAGMFVDVAHLVQALAAPRVVHARGYLVLPNAFEGTVPRSPDGGTELRRRAFAAMRELRRFSREVSFENGYPMYYEEAARAKSDGILRGRLNKTLFELLYYFDEGMRRDDRTSAEVRDGITPLIAEAILLWIDGRTSGDLLSHTANLTEAKLGKVTAGILHPQAAIAGGMGVFSLQLPIDQFVEEWAHDLGREVLKSFLGIAPENGEDEHTKAAIRLMDNWAGGVSGIPGSDAAHLEWQKGEVGGVGASELVKDYLRTGLAVQSGKATAEKRKSELLNRSLVDWLQKLSPPEGPSEEDERLVAQFLAPQEIVIEDGGVFGGIFDRDKRKVNRAEVRTTDFLEGDARKDEKRNPTAAANRIERETDIYFNEHLGSVNASEQRRGGTDLNPEGEYPSMLRTWSDRHIAHYYILLRGWAAQSLNGTNQLERTNGETAETAVRNRAGRIGFTLGLLTELTSMLHECEMMLEDLERASLGIAVSSRNSSQLAEYQKEMRKTMKAQLVYLSDQQAILQQERQYAVVRAARWAVGQMHAFTKSALDALRAWEKALTKELYPSVWKGQEQVADNLKALKTYSAVRHILDLPETKMARFKYYAQTEQRAKENILNDFRWRIEVTEAYDAAKKDYLPQLTIGLSLGMKTLAVDGPMTNSRAYVMRCRSVFQSARTHESVLKWLRGHYDDKTDDRRVGALASYLSGKGKLTLRTLDGANPYRFAYVRAHYTLGSDDEGWLKGLVTNLAQRAGADTTHSQPVISSDPYRLTLLLFNELIDVEKLTSYEEGWRGIAGAGGYQHLPAVSGGTDLARQTLHVFAAERNASIYEQRLGRLLSDKIVALLEDKNRFRQFVQLWAYGQLHDGKEILLNSARLPDDHGSHPGAWVRKLTTGPFPEEIDPYTGRSQLAKQRWLTEPSRERPSLYAAAETFCLRGADKWQKEGQPHEEDRSLKIDYGHVVREINRRQEELWRNEEVGKSNHSLQDIVNAIIDQGRKQAATNRLLDYGYLGKVQARLWEEILPAAQQAVKNWRDATGDDDQHRADEASRLSETELDIELLMVMREFIRDEMEATRADIQQQRSGVVRANDQSGKATANNPKPELPIY